MKTMSLSEAKDKLSKLVEEVESTHERVRITRHGHGAAVVIAEDDLEAMTETIRVLSTPGALDELHQATADYAAAATTSGEDLRRRYGLDPT
jgi:prevent-host-death family protein